MRKPFQAFMEQLIDYAGTFPPANLSLHEAIQNYAQYRKDRDAWMLSRFICPASRLPELQTYGDTLFQEGEPFRFSVLSRGGNHQGEFLQNLQKDLADIAAFREALGERVVIDVFETKIPGDILRRPSKSAAHRFLNSVGEVFETQAPAVLRPFYEALSPDDWKKVISAMVKGIAEHNLQNSLNQKYTRYQTAGIKLRCGGTEPSMYPSAGQIAQAIILCRDEKVPLKTTAGLHHPIRHFSKEAGVTMHGFLNVFAAGILAYAHELSVSEVQEIIQDENPENFLFTAKAFAWQNLRVSVDEIQTVRQNTLLSFGSCSFDEPREDLRALRLI